MILGSSKLPKTNTTARTAAATAGGITATPSVAGTAGHDWKADADDELLCAYCGADAQDRPAERDPDDARDERMDREMDR